MKLKLKKYEQALVILPRKDFDRLVLYDWLKQMGYRWNSHDRKWYL
ncbi:MAG: hypothetical protein JGK38_23840 [Microcoleus sp. PH2017_15_JOR_U_A]|nr:MULTISPECIES: hypothetical protein [unclassified Microcoleus]MCC3473290.1 hypothetical protein [Microcoleus sp. PH2017_13_LAR_U_A]MCC3486543.1 hypothetical protein [Microcoleus sp. PH2017_14_LAR_D_A]MCC3499589.1 hypothetical protein [Microcoleus sp. PH2017_15_JOR_U_A]MCC3600161.1 hypothetical protein [Microcoleus sp. PH2017_26_ELK_O_A]MCC3623186.1 hypothetical protein [Microcoleus sp. PH2017_36_ELK_O_B]